MDCEKEQHLVFAIVDSRNGMSAKVKSSERNENTANERKRDRFINTLICSLSPFRRSSMRWAHSAQSISQLSQNLSNDSTLFFMWLFFFLLVNCFIHCNSFVLFCVLNFVLGAFSICFSYFFFQSCGIKTTTENRSKQLLSLSMACNWSHRKICICMHKCSENVRIFLGIFSISWQCSQWNFCGQLNCKLSVADSKRVATRTIFRLCQANYSSQVHCVFSILPVHKCYSCTNWTASISRAYILLTPDLFLYYANYCFYCHFCGWTEQTFLINYDKWR